MVFNGKLRQDHMARDKSLATKTYPRFQKNEVGDNDAKLSKGKIKRNPDVNIREREELSRQLLST